MILQFDIRLALFGHTMRVQRTPDQATRKGILCSRALGYHLQLGSVHCSLTPNLKVITLP